jgi:hypothetical protein
LCMAMITIGEKHTKVRLKCYGGLIYICTIIMTIWIVEDIYGTA